MRLRTGFSPFRALLPVDNLGTPEQDDLGTMAPAGRTLPADEMSSLQALEGPVDLGRGKLYSLRDFPQYSGKDPVSPAKSYDVPDNIARQGHVVKNAPLE
ncbi:MAG: hypothetical protein QXP01_03770 [Candidatus Hadarchaeum sp.]